MAYRSEKRRAGVRPAPEPGLVTEMVRQFADPYAFLRELVQNSIDAGTTSIAVRVERASDGTVRTSVLDDGCGMTPEVIESALLTLFASTKEGDSTKVGKYGVGFMSVFAIEPERVVVETWREGKAHELVLAPDHSYELRELLPRAGSGTRVVLEQALEPADFERHAERCRAALARWCGHVSVPLRFAWLDEGAPASGGEISVAAPLDVEAVVKIRAPVTGGEVVLGCAPPDAPGRTLAGFYNRGLTLHTSSEPIAGLAGVRFALNSDRIAHTLSRDNVRRDAAFDALIDEVRELARGALRDEATRALQAAAAEGTPELYGALLATARAAPLALERGELSFPLTDPIAETAVMNGDVIARLTPAHTPVLWAHRADALTAALAEARRPVVRCATTSLARVVAEVFGARTLFGPWGFARAHELWSLVEAVPEKQLGKVPAELAEALAGLLAASGHAVAAVRWARFRGARLERSAVLLDPDAGPLQSARTLARSRRFSRGRALVLDVESKVVVAARARARKDLASAAQLLARALLVELGGALGAGENRALLACFDEAGR